MSHIKIMASIVVPLLLGCAELCNGQNENLSIGGEKFSLGMAESEALQQVSRLSADKPEVVRDEGGVEYFTIFKSGRQLGMLSFTNARLSCAVAGPLFLVGAQPSDLTRSLITFFKKISDDGVTPLNVWTETHSGAEGKVIAVEEVHWEKSPYRYTLSRTSGEQPVVSVTEMLGTCRKGK